VLIIEPLVIFVQKMAPHLIYSKLNQVGDVIKTLNKQGGGLFLLMGLTLMIGDKMTDLIDDTGDVANERTVACIKEVQATVKQHLDCLIDSGAKPAEIKAVAQNFCEAIGVASDEAILDLAEQVKEKEDETD
jgi:hypothetical protein